MLFSSFYEMNSIFAFLGLYTICLGFHIANAETHEPIDILPNRRKDTISHYLSEYGSNVKMVVMDVNPAVAVKNIKSTCNYRRSVSLLSLYSLGYR